MKNNNVNTTIDSKEIETKGQKRRRNMLDVIATVMLVIMTLLLVLSIAGFLAENGLERLSAPTGEEMLSSINLYGIENVRPFDIVESSIEYKVYDNRKEDKFTNLAVALGEYQEAALYNYAYEYVGDVQNAQKNKRIMDDARSRMEVQSYANSIDSILKKYSEQ